jgi:Mg2+ and Co2+ transporter CorA
MLESPDERAKLRPEEAIQSAGRVESWLHKTSPGVLVVSTLKSNPDGKVRWLRDADLLPHDLDHARILSFEYAVPVDDGKPPSLSTLTEGLRNSLSETRQGCKNRPLIFIGHDFGITIIERALMECAEDPGLVVDICKVTAGILFFATPTESVSEEEQDISYFETRDTRLGPKGKIKYVEVQDTTFLDEHLNKFKDFTTWLAGLRPAMALHSLQSDGKIASKDVEAYRKTLSIINELLKVYRLLDAADEGNQDRVKALLKEDPNPNLHDSAQQSPLHLAVRKNHTQVVRLLLSNGADVSLPNIGGMTALHFAVTSNPKTGAIIEMLLDEGADVDALNAAGDSVLELAKQAGVTPASLKNQHLIKGPSEDISDLRREPVPPTISSAVEACSELQATLAEFYLIERQEQLMIQRPYVYELLYERGPDEIMAAARKREVPENLEPRCRWYHLPANHIGWVNDLFARMNLVPDSTQEDEHHGMTAWSRYMRPKARVFKPVQYSKAATGKWQSKESTGNNFVLYIPFLNFERNCDMLHVYKIDERRSEFLGEKFAPVRTVREVVRTPQNGGSCSSDVSNSAPPSNAAHSGEFFHDSVADPASPGAMPTWRLDRDSSWYQNKRRTSSTSSDDDPLDIEKKLLRGHLWNENPHKPGELHVRRTLDQSHYFMLRDTSDRDWDQVVLREARRLKRVARRPRPRWRRRRVAASMSSDTETDDDEKDESERWPLVVVDQLWLWVIGDTVVTSFPQKFRQPDWQLNCDVAEQLRQHLKKDKTRAPVTSAHDLANLIITYCVSVFNRKQPRSSGLLLHDYFETSVGVVADSEMRMFRAFEAASKEDPYEILEKQKKRRRKDRERNEKGQDYAAPSDDDEDDLFDIRKEINLLDEVKDIRDEIRMILRVLNDQALAVGDVATILQPDSPDPDPSSPGAAGKTDTNANPACGDAADTINRRTFTSPDLSHASTVPPELPHQITTTFTEGATEAPIRSDVITVPYKERHPCIDANIRDFERMLTHANASYEALNHLLDLKQKQANALEARLARIGVESGAKQANTIMVFTVATIVFGSLSFVAAFFALNVTAFPKLPDGSTTAWNLGQLVGYVTGLAIALSLPFVIIAFMINPIAETVWSKDKSVSAKGPKNKWSRAIRKAFDFLVLSWLSRLLPLKRWKEMDSSYSYTASYSSSCSSAEYASYLSQRHRGFFRSLWRRWTTLLASITLFFRNVVAKMGLKSRQADSSYASSLVSSDRPRRKRR